MPASTFSTKKPKVTQGKYGTIEDFGGGGMAYSDPRDNPNYKAPALSLDEPKSEVTVVSTQSGKNALKPSVMDQEKDIQNITKANEKANQNALALSASGQDKNSQSKKGYSYEEAKLAGLDLNNARYDGKTGTFIPTDDDPEEVKNMQFKRDLDEVDRVFASQEKSMDAAQRAVLESISGIYRQIGIEQRDANKRQYESYRNFGVREGGERYAGEINQGILNSEERAGLARLETIAAKEAAAIAEAGQAYNNKKYEFFLEKRGEITKLREKRQEEIDALYESAQKKREEIQKAQMQASRDSAISGLILQGVTDPNEILAALNEASEASGYGPGDFTAEEVSKSLKALSPEGDYDKLSSNLRDYFILRDNGSLPPNIAALPPEQQLTAWVDYTKPKKVPGVGKVNKITLSEAKAQNLPLSVVGMSEDEIISDLQNTEPPQWFWEKANKEANMSLVLARVKPLWDKYRAALGEEFEPSTTEDENVYSTKDYTQQATKYLKGLYGDQLSDDEVQQYADLIQQYIDGGMSYQKAVEAVME